MAARSRPRAGQIKEDFDEERSLWSQILEEAKRIDVLTVSTAVLFLLSLVVLAVPATFYAFVCSSHLYPSYVSSTPQHIVSSHFE